MLQAHRKGKPMSSMQAAIAPQSRFAQPAWPAHAERPAPSDRPAAERSWRQPQLNHYAGARVGRVYSRAWSGLSAVVSELHVNGAFETRSVSPYARLLVVLDEVGGRLRARVDGASAAPVERSNAMFFFPAGASVCEFSEKLRFVRHICFQFDQTTLSQLVRSDFVAKLPQAPRLSFYEPRLLGLARLFEAECMGEPNTDPLFGDSLSVSLLSLLMDIEATASELLTGRGLTPRMLGLVTAHLDAHLADPICPQTLAALCRLSASHFCRAFKNSTGMPPHTWLTERRIQRAKEALMAGELSLAQIALFTGFSDQPHFTRVFARIVGTSPGAWRRQHLS